MSRRAKDPNRRAIDKMSRISLQTQWNALIQDLRQREKEFAVSALGDPLPTHIFHVNNNGSIEERTINGVQNTIFRAVYLGKKPTRDDVARLKYYMEHGIDFQIEGIIFFWESVQKTYTVSGATPLPDIDKAEFSFFDSQRAQTKADEIKAKREHEQALLASGHIKCRYCGAIRKPEDIVHKAIFSGMYRNLRSDPRPYCKDKGCAGYDQMGHEG
jgi:hypothetical protein